MPRVKIATGPRLGEAVQTFLAIREGLPEGNGNSPSTMAGLTWYLRALVLAFGEQTRLDSITPLAMIKLWADAEGPVQRRTQSAGVRSAVTINKLRAAYLVFFGFCRDAGWLPPGQNPMSMIKKLKITEHERLWLDEPETLRVINLARYPNHKILMMLQARTGARVADIEHLSYGQVDLARGRVLLRVGKAQGSALSQQITPDLDAALREWFITYQELLGQPLRETDPLVPSIFPFPVREPGVYPFRLRPSDDGTPAYYSRSAGSAIVGDYLALAGYKWERQASHVLRRSGAVALLAESARVFGYGQAVRIVQEWLGHKSITQTELYLNCGWAKEALDEVLSGWKLGAPPVSGGLGIAPPPTEAPVRWVKAGNDGRR